MLDGAFDGDIDGMTDGASIGFVVGFIVGGLLGVAVGMPLAMDSVREILLVHWLKYLIQLIQKYRKASLTEKQKNIDI